MTSSQEDQKVPARRRNAGIARSGKSRRFPARMAFASLLLGAGGILELALAIMGSYVGRINGFTSGWIAAAYVEAVFIIPAILRAIHAELPRFRTVLANTLSLG